MKKLVIAGLGLVVLVGCSSNAVTCTSETDTVKRTVKMELKDAAVVKLEEESVFKMSTKEQLDAYADYYRQFDESKKVPGFTFDYTKSADALTIKTTVDYVVSDGMAIEQYFTKNIDSAQKIVTDSEDKKIDTIKAALESQGNFNCSAK